MTGRDLVAIVVVVLCLTGIVGVARAAAEPAPWGTATVRDDISACADATAPMDNVVCAVAMTRRWLEHTGHASVVRRTVEVSDPAAGLTWNPRNRDICVYAELGTLLNLGVHHCDSTTFVNRSTDAALIRTRARAVTTFAHESSHGVQEAVGLTPVSTTIFGPVEDLRRLELASDCWSGAAWSWYVSSGLLTVADRIDATAFMYSLRDKVSHGSGAQRGHAFERGIVEGAGACDEILGRPAYT